MLRPASSYRALRDGFRWNLPPRLNMARQACFDRAAAEPGGLALIDLTGETRVDLSFGDLAGMAHGLARHLAGAGVGPGDRVAVFRTQSPWTAAAHLAVWQLGAISVPLFKLFGPDALRVRLGDSGARHVVCDAEGAGALGGLSLPLHVPEDLTLERAPFPIADTGPEDPAVLIYTSGTTGAPKGALHGHLVLTGHLPGVEVSHDYLGQPGDCLWTPADWAWIGGLFDVLMPGLALGVPVVAARLPKFTSAACLKVIRAGTVRNVFFPPTALKMLRADGVRLPGLRSVASGGEPLGAQMLDWGRGAFGLTINEFYGQTECNMVASSCAGLFVTRPGCIGRAVPGFELAVLDDTGQPVADAEGEVAVARGAASMMLGYWQNAAATAEKFRGDWMLTGDRGIWDGPDLRFVGREDDVISSAGYRIGPSEIEDCLIRHASVSMAAVVGKPCALRGQAVVAYVVLSPGHTGDEALAQALKAHVGRNLSHHLTPREVTFVDSLPMTVTGKIIRRALKARAMAEAGDADDALDEGKTP